MIRASCPSRISRKAGVDEITATTSSPVAGRFIAGGISKDQNAAYRDQLDPVDQLSIVFPTVVASDLVDNRFGQWRYPRFNFQELDRRSAVRQ